MNSLNNIDLLFILSPLIVFAIHVTWGPKMKIFGHEDGLTAGVLILAAFYLLAVAAVVFLETRFLGYSMLVISFSLRPMIIWFNEVLALRYIENHRYLNRGDHNIDRNFPQYDI